MPRLARVLDRLTGRTRRPPPTRADSIEFAYEPRPDGDADPGEVVWGWVPFEDDPTQGKDRPIVVVGYWGDDLCGVPLTSKTRPGDADRLAVGTGDWDRERRTSYACLDRTMRLGRTAVRREGTTLDRERFTQLVDALRARHRKR
jgi:hypothetical protein